MDNNHTTFSSLTPLLEFNNNNDQFESSTGNRSSVVSTLLLSVREQKALAKLEKPNNIKKRIWNFIGLYPNSLVGKNNKELAVCNLCRDNFKADNIIPASKWEVIYKSSSSKLTDHLASEHKVEYAADLKLEQDEEAKIRLLKEGNLSGPMDKHISKVSKESMVRSHFVKWVVMNRLSCGFFTMVESS
eukprot:gene18514-26144_t